MLKKLIGTSRLGLTFLASLTKLDGMKFRAWLGVAAVGALAASCRPANNNPTATSSPPATNLSFIAKGTVRELRPNDQAVLIAHDAISNYMPAMTMSFKVRQTNELAGLGVGNEISFRLWVGAEESWIDQIAKTGKRDAPTGAPNGPATGTVSPTTNRQALLDYQFTNQLGQAVSLSQFKGQALAITFIFTRCPIPEYCPRLSRNFAEAAQKLRALPEAPTNWHFLSVSFDPAFDTPEVLQAYAGSYHYDPKHWSFITGAPDKIAELAQASEVTATRDGSFYNHNFRTLIINANGELQMSFPVSGNLSDAIVTEMLKAAAVTNR